MDHSQRANSIRQGIQKDNVWINPVKCHSEAPLRRRLDMFAFKNQDQLETCPESQRWLEGFQLDDGRQQGSVPWPPSPAEL